MPLLRHMHPQSFQPLGMKDFTAVTSCVHSTSQFTKHVRSHAWIESSIHSCEAGRGCVTTIVQMKKLRL
jgi:hypothetical protein